MKSSILATSKNVKADLLKHWTALLLCVFVGIYIVYFSFYTVLRMRTLYASYYDLGIMNQTVYNTYQAVRTGDFSRFLELTDTDDVVQIKRMAIHDDFLLALFAPFYFLRAGPETLLVLQSIILGLGAIAVYGIAKIVFQKRKDTHFLPLLFATSYLLYPPLERSNMFDFHAVTAATTFLLFMFYFWLKRQYKLSFLFYILALLSKEQVGLTGFFFGLYSLWSQRTVKTGTKRRIGTIFSVLVAAFGLGWVFLTVNIITPLFRGGHHFALDYYGDFGDSPIRIIIGIIKHPYSVFQRLVSVESLRYLTFLFGPLAFLSLLSPLILVITLPELSINLLSSSSNMRNIFYHYSAVITPFVFISAIYGAQKAIELFEVKKNGAKIIFGIILLFSVMFAYLKGPLPFAKEKEVHPFLYPQKEIDDTMLWARVLKNEKLKISATGQLSPFFTSRRYFYDFSDRYTQADYIVVRLNEIYTYPEKDKLIPAYQKLKRDARFKLIYKRVNFEVYKKI